MIRLMKKTYTACFNAALAIAILIGLMLFKRFAVRVRIEATEIQSA